MGRQRHTEGGWPGDSRSGVEVGAQEVPDTCPGEAGDRPAANTPRSLQMEPPC